MGKEHGRKRCSQIIRTSIYERATNENLNWWLRLFKILEEMPDRQEQIDIVQEIFPGKIFKTILTLMNLNDDKRVSDYFSLNLQMKYSKSEIIERLNEKQITKCVYSTATGAHKNKEVGPNNPYLNFFRRSEEKARIWRKLPVPVYIDTVELATKKIATDFVKWLKKIESETTNTKELDLPLVTTIFIHSFGKQNRKSFDEQSDPLAGICGHHRSKIHKKSFDLMDVADITSMFKINLSSDAQCSFVDACKELPRVTVQVATECKLPEMSTTEANRRFLGISEMKSMKKKNVVRHPDIWTKESAGRTHLCTMAGVWKGITKLTSTISYCKWLATQPHHPRPKFLVDNGMFDENIHRVSSDTQFLNAPSVLLTEALSNIAFNIGTKSARQYDDNDG